MDDAGAALRGVGLLERSVSYLLGCLHLVTANELHGATPCRDWDLQALLEHLDDSLLAMHEATRGHVAAVPPTGEECVGAQLLYSVRTRARQLVGAWLTPSPSRAVDVDGLSLTAGVACAAGAIELAVHGWDVARACGPPLAIPPALADDLGELAPLLVTDADRPQRFNQPVRVPGTAVASDLLVAFLGRDPYLTPIGCSASYRH